MKASPTPTDWLQEMIAAEKTIATAVADMKQAAEQLAQGLCSIHQRFLDQLRQNVETKAADSHVAELELYCDALLRELRYAQSLLGFFLSTTSVEIRLLFEQIENRVPFDYKKHQQEEMLLKAIDGILDQIPVVANVKAIAESELLDQAKKRTEVSDNGFWKRYPVHEWIEKVQSWQRILEKKEQMHFSTRAAVLIGRVQALLNVDDEIRNLLNGLLTKLPLATPDFNAVELGFQRIKDQEHCST